jgi:hypothetical protein
MKRCTFDEGQPHAALDAVTRHAKARKTEGLPHLDDRPGPLRLLQVGTGSC